MLVPKFVSTFNYPAWPCKVQHSNDLGHAKLSRFRDKTPPNPVARCNFLSRPFLLFFFPYGKPSKIRDGKNAGSRESLVFRCRFLLPFLCPLRASDRIDEKLNPHNFCRGVDTIYPLFRMGFWVGIMAKVFLDSPLASR